MNDHRTGSRHRCGADGTGRRDSSDCVGACHFTEETGGGSRGDVQIVRSGVEREGTVAREYDRTADRTRVVERSCVAGCAKTKRGHHRCGDYQAFIFHSLSHCYRTARGFRRVVGSGFIFSGFTKTAPE